MTFSIKRDNIYGKYVLVSSDIRHRYVYRLCNDRQIYARRFSRQRHYPARPATADAFATYLHTVFGVYSSDAGRLYANQAAYMAQGISIWRFDRTGRVERLARLGVVRRDISAPAFLRHQPSGYLSLAHRHRPAHNRRIQVSTDDDSGRLNSKIGLR